MSVSRSPSATVTSAGTLSSRTKPPGILPST
jgi:hypothetical protein